MKKFLTGFVAVVAVQAGLVLTGALFGATDAEILLASVVFLPMNIILTYFTLKDDVANTNNT